MALWLWVTDLDPKNDWLEVLSLSWGARQTGWGAGSGGISGSSVRDVHITLKAGRFGSRLFSWVINGGARTAYVFIDPQTEYQFFGAIPASLSSNNEGLYSLTINYESMKVEHSGAP